MGPSKPMSRSTPGTNVMTATGREAAGACAGSGHTTALGAADWLSLVAAPTFAIMALLTLLLGRSPDFLCVADASPLSGMVPMYVLMSAFHLAPWLKLISSRQSGIHRSRRFTPIEP
jgi:hypothetical protein